MKERIRTMTEMHVETLAILLYKEDARTRSRTMEQTPWLVLEHEDREIYREMARGERDLIE